ncbi:hypothetical protein RSAG8_13038, partial [Rhizoctonia solani AG-8 WAC10335]
MRVLPLARMQAACVWSSGDAWDRTRVRAAISRRELLPKLLSLGICPGSCCILLPLFMATYKYSYNVSSAVEFASDEHPIQYRLPKGLKSRVLQNIYMRD